MISVRRGHIDEVPELISGIKEFKNPPAREEFQHRFTNEHLILIAEEENHPVGFKCGYVREPESRSFYSWMGGVLENYRNRGVASLLLKEMEEWVKVRGFDALEFKTLNEHKSMLIFAIKRGFEIVAVSDSEKDDRKRIHLRKHIS